MNRRLSIAPMMDWTDRHCRAFHRTLTTRALLYTEMVTAPAVLHGDQARLLGFDAVEHPVALQLGGSDPAQLAEAARIGEAYGYDEINLNVGCPSDRVQSGRFGACLMREPELVAECMAAIREAVPLVGSPLKMPRLKPVGKVGVPDLMPAAIVVRLFAPLPMAEMMPPERLLLPPAPIHCTPSSVALETLTSAINASM